MNFGHLAIFHAVLRSGSVSRAAEQLMISQPAVSKQLKELERSLGTALFDRLPKGMRPTPAGELLGEYASRIFSTAIEAGQALDELRGLRRGKLIVGASTTIGVYLLPEVFVAFRRKFPDVQLELEIANSDVILKRLEDGAIQLGLTEGVIASGSVQTSAFATDRLVAIAPCDHPLSRKRSIDAKTLCREPFIVRETGSGTKSVVERALIARGLSIQPAMSLGSTEAIKRAVAGGVGVAIVSELSIRLELEARRLVKLRVSDLEIERPLHRLMLPGRNETSVVAAFMAMIASVIKGVKLK